MKVGGGKSQEMCTIIFFTKNCYLCAARISFSPVSAILSAPHRCCHQLLLSQCAPHLKYTYNASQVNFHQVQEWNQIFTAPRYICPIMAVQIFWPTARKPLSNLRAQIGGPGGSQTRFDMEQNLNILGAKMWLWGDCEVYKEAAGFDEDIRTMWGYLAINKCIDTVVKHF